MVDGRGAVLYGGTLGMGGTMFPVVQDAGVGLDAGGVGDGGSGRDGGAAPPPTEPGCGCRAQESEREGWGMEAWWAVAVAVVGARRRRR